MEQYNKNISMHYSAYRPPLHQMILKRVIADGEKVETGLDIGCGTGYSSIALLNHCKKVQGIDPSGSMLDKAEANKNITYKVGCGDDIPVSNNSIDIVTFAGSLFYAKSDVLITELQRVCKENALVVVYDFQVLTDSLLLDLGIGLKESKSNYDHEINFTGYTALSEISAGKEYLEIDVTPEQLAHILLSSFAYEQFVKKYDFYTPFNLLVSELKSMDATGKLKTVIGAVQFDSGTAIQHLY